MCYSLNSLEGVKYGILWETVTRAINFKLKLLVVYVVCLWNISLAHELPDQNKSTQRLAQPTLATRFINDLGRHGLYPQILLMDIGNL